MKTTMKKYLYLAAAALALTACSNDEELTVNNGPVAAKIYANINGVQTRASGTSWNDGDQIGISSASTGKTNYTNICYNVANTAAGSFTTDTPIYFEDPQPVTFSAYYPWDETLGADLIIEKTVTAEDQESEAQKKIDYMYATGATASKAAPEVKFTDERGNGGADARFKHRMSRLTLMFRSGEGTKLTDMTDFTISGLKMAGTFNTAKGTAIANTEAKATDLKITETPSDENEYTRSLIVFPQEVISFTLSVTLDGETYSATLVVPDSREALIGGDNYNFTVIVSKTKLQVSSASIADWNNGGTTDVDATLQ